MTLLQLHTLGTSFRGSHGSALIAAAPASYSIPQPTTEISKNMVAGLLSDGNLIYPRVYFNEKGCVLSAPDDKEVRHN